MSIPVFNFFTLTVLVFSLHPSQSVKTVVVDGLAEQQVTTIQVEESLVFEHLPNLYLFHSRRAFDLCNFAEARLIFDGSSSNSTQFTWHAPRLGHYYFSTRDGSQCEKGEKVPVRVITPDISSPAASPHAAPPPTAGGILPAFPSPGTLSSSPIMAPDAAPLRPRDAPALAGPSPRSAPSGEGIPFISSNPAVPLPTGETDTATIRPLPTPGDENNQVVGMGSSVGAGVAAVVVSLMMSSALGLWL